MVRSLDELARRVLDGVESEWGAPAVEPSERFVGLTVDTETLLLEIVDPITSVAALEHDLVAFLPRMHWRARNPWPVTLDEDRDVWSHFAEELRHERRFFLHLSPEDEATQHAIGYTELLAEVTNGLRTCKLLRRLARGARIHRMRVSKTGKRFTRASELGPPRFEIDRQPNRVSPCGRPMLHAAFDARGAAGATYEPRYEAAMASLATFRTRRELLLLDLTKLPNTPSLYDPEHRGERPYLAFLRTYAEELAKPIVRGQDEQIGYVPTQVVTNYLRHHLADVNGHAIDGIVHANQRVPTSPTCVLFARNRDCGERGAQTLLELERVKHKALAPRTMVVG